MRIVGPAPSASCPKVDFRASPADSAQALAFRGQNSSWRGWYIVDLVARLDGAHELFEVARTYAALRSFLGDYSNKSPYI